MRVALIAHDDKKSTLIDWATKHEETLSEHDLIATGTTGKRLNEETNLSVTRMESGPLGGDMVIGSDIVTGDCHALFFFRDPLTAQAHEPDISAILRICDVHNVPLATNEESATAVLKGLTDDSD